jgi:hypothetical protein
LISLLTLLAGPAAAGDPCPIALQLFEVTPTWRDRTEDLAALTTQRSWLGLTFGGRDTTTIKAVLPNSPAHAAGVQPGDTVLTVAGTPLTERGELDALLAAAGDPLALTLGREGGTVPVQLSRGPADPVFLGLVQAAEAHDCRQVKVGALSAEQAAALATGAFDAQRGFRCDDAHQRLDGAFGSGDLVVVRGGRRLLLTTPGWATRCVDVAAYDGDTLTDTRLGELLDTVTSAYVQDRHDNP